MTKRQKLLQLYQIKKHVKENKILLFYQYNNVNTRDWGLLRGELLNETASCKPSPLPSYGMKELGESIHFKGSITSRCQDAGEDSPVSAIVVKSKIGQLSLAQTLSTELGISISMPASLRDARGSIRAVKEAERMVLGAGTKTSPYTISNTNCVELFKGPTFLFACNSHNHMVIGCKVIEKKRDRYSNNYAVLLGGIYYGKVVTHLDVAKLSALNSSIYASLPITLGNKMDSLLVDGLSHIQCELLRCLEHHRGNLLQGKES